MRWFILAVAVLLDPAAVLLLLAATRGEAYRPPASCTSRYSPIRPTRDSAEASPSPHATTLRRV
jgi:hypothetical protein